MHQPRIAALALALTACTTPTRNSAPTLPPAAIPAASTAPGGVTDPAGSVADVFAQVNRAVVTVRTVGRTGPATAGGQLASEAELGSGVLIDAEGTILTAAHVVQIADKITVEFATGRPIKASVLSSDPDADLALLRLSGPIPEGVLPAVLGDSNSVRVGDRVLVVGAPRGISHTLSVGHVSARRFGAAGLGAVVPVEQFQTDAAINLGNSGGPMFDLAGRVIGVVSHIVSASGGSEGLGFAVTSNTARELMLERRPFWSGIAEIELTPELAAALNVPGGAHGALILQVARGSIGEQLGLRGGHLPAVIGETPLILGGDIVLQVLGVPLGQPSSATRITERVLALAPGDPLTVQVLRAGQILELAAPFDR